MPSEGVADTKKTRRDGQGSMLSKFYFYIASNNCTHVCSIYDASTYPAHWPRRALALASMKVIELICDTRCLQLLGPSRLLCESQSDAQSDN